MLQRIYLAGPYGLRDYLAKKVAPELRIRGHHVSSSWINDPPENDKVADYLRCRKRGEGTRNGFYDAILTHEASRDVLDVYNSTVLMRFESSDLKPSGGGKFWETGLAFGLGLQVIVVGKKETVFDYLADDMDMVNRIVVEPTFDHALDFLDTLGARHECVV